MEWRRNSKWPVAVELLHFDYDALINWRDLDPRHSPLCYEVEDDGCMGGLRESSRLAIGIRVSTVVIPVLVTGIQVSTVG